MHKGILLNVLEYYCFDNVHKDSLKDIFRYISTEYKIEPAEIEKTFQECVTEGRIRYVEAQKRYYF